MMRQRYAAHYLVLGNKVVTYPLVTIEHGYLVSVEAFEEEQQSVIFLDGIIRLVSEERTDSYLSVEGHDKLTTISMTQMQTLIHSYRTPLIVELPS